MRAHRLGNLFFLVGLGFSLATSCLGLAAEIRITATDSDVVNIAKIEGAEAGDVVIIAPGIYRFRLYLEGKGGVTKPIVIRAEDAGNRPIWDLGGKPTAEWPGSYSGGDKGRAIWQITGTHYEISSIVFRNGSDFSVGDGGGVRLKSSSDVTIRNCLFQFNDNGLQGAGAATLVEFSEFDRNGLPGSPEVSHNLYIHGGDITVRYSYIHDARRGQNLHIRANRALFEYNWIARSTTYMADMMPCTMQPCDANQYLVFRGNVFVRGSPRNNRQVFALVNDQGAKDLGLHFSMINNTVIGNGDYAALIHFVNARYKPSRIQSVRLVNNALIDVARVSWIDRSALLNWSLKGAGNWVTAGTAGAQDLTNTLSGTSPGFKSLAGNDFVPVIPSELIGAAVGGQFEPPVREYYRDEKLAMRWRLRRTVKDIGAFESTTSGGSFGFEYGTDQSKSQKNILEIR